MFSINRRSLLRSTGIAGVASVTASLFPELSPLAAFAKEPAPTARPWFAQRGIAQEEAAAGAARHIDEDLLPRLRRLASARFGSDVIDPETTAKVVVSTMEDGSTVTAWARPIDREHVAAVYTERDGKGRPGRTHAFIWQIDESSRSGRLILTGPALESLTDIKPQSSGGLPAAHALDCGYSAYECSVCVGFDGGFIDCCGPCAFAFAAFWWGVACVAAWCIWCIWEHCTDWEDSCCAA